jgi:hypothetical protein
MNFTVSTDLIENVTSDEITDGQSAVVPIALTSRADGPMNRVASALLAPLAAHNARRDQPRKAW